MKIEPQLSAPQARFLRLPQRFGLFVGGFGSGKTWAGCAKICKTAWSHPGATQGYFGPTHAHTRDIFFPTIVEVAEDWGLDATVYRANREVSLSHGGKVRSLVICRSMDRPDSIVGFKLARAVVDEIDTMPMMKAFDAWRKIIARLRQDKPGLSNGADVTTTPEGFSFVWQTWVQKLRERPELKAQYGMTRASTYENAHHLPDGYIDSLIATYPENLIQAYLHGEFVNLQQGSVYRDFDRSMNASYETMQPHEPVFVGMDFNVGHMAAVIHVKRNGDPHAVDEIIDGYDTPDMIRKLKERCWGYMEGEYRSTREIRVYPDSSGGSRRSVEASTTDIRLLKDAGFVVSAPLANPPVKDRVNALCAMICNAEGKRRYKINPDKCPTATEHLERQAYANNGEPDKTSGMDHTNDAIGYFIHRDYPLVRPITRLNIGFAQ